MCNLYSHTRSVEEVRRWFYLTRVDASAGNLPAQPSIFPAYDAPVIRLSGDGIQRELTMMKWGFVLPQGKAFKRRQQFWKRNFKQEFFSRPGQIAPNRGPALL